ncbi:MAG: LysM peptidoglycan-binding domain-containing protein [Planctomycetota bacterium]|nr:LysM peptidoglycan-binding domain-containing protein [Planctomycetota bacterium]
MAIGVVLALTCTAGALLWRNYSPLLTANGEQELASDEESADDESADTSEVSSTEVDDELEMLDARKTPLVARTPPSSGARRPTRMPVEADETDDELEREELPSKQPIRRVAASVPAGARSGFNGGRTVRVPSTTDDFDSLANGDDESEEPEAPPAQSEPDETEFEEETPALRRRAELARRAPVQEEPADETDEAVEEEVEQPSLNSPRRRLSTANEIDETEDTESPPPLKIADSDDPPPLRINRAPRSGGSAIGGTHNSRVELATPRGGRSRGEAVPAGLAESATNSDSDDETVDGYVAVDPRERRAMSRTTVLKPADVASEDTDSGPPHELDHSTQGGRNSRDPNRVAITPRGKSVVSHQPVAPAPKSSPRGIDRSHPADVDHVAGSYRVEPSDTYWSISKKVYGTPRYFQALAEHNRPRVAEPEQLRPGVELETPAEADLVAKYAKYIPGGGRSAPAEHVAEAGFDDHPKYGVASQSPARRVGGRELRSEVSKDVDGDRPLTAAGGAGFHYSRSGEPMFRVGDGDTLSSIAQQHLGKSSRSQELYQLNQDRLADPDRLRVGTVLRLPTDASRVGVLSRAERIR